MTRPDLRSRVEVMDVSKAANTKQLVSFWTQEGWSCARLREQSILPTYSVATFSSPGRAAIAAALLQACSTRCTRREQTKRLSVLVAVAFYSSISKSPKRRLQLKRPWLFVNRGPTSRPNGGSRADHLANVTILFATSSISRGV